jgi:glycosyltransferase involved in cell wall biosynthesis
MPFEIRLTGLFKTLGCLIMNDQELRSYLTQASVSLSVIMPVYNEVTRVSTAIKEVLKAAETFDLELIIVESASSDGTREIVQSFFAHPKVTLVLQDKPLGKGNAVREGLKIAGKRIVCVFDSDLEYAFTDVFSLLLPIAEGKSEFVLGSRWAGHSIRTFDTHSWRGTLLNVAHVIGAQLINMSYGIRTQDPFTMWKVFTRESIHEIEFICERFDWDLEVIGELALRGIKPIEVPVTYRSRDYSQGKKIRFSTEVPILLKVIFRIFIKRVRRVSLIGKGLGS